MTHRKHLLSNLLAACSSSRPSPFCQPSPSPAFPARHSKMPHSFLLRRLSFAIVTAVDSVAGLLLACESHIPPSPRIHRSSPPRSPPPHSPHRVRRNTSLSAPSSPTSVNPHHAPLPRPHPTKAPSADSHPPALRRSRTRHHRPVSSRLPSSTLRPSATHPRLTRRQILPPSVRHASHRHAPARRQTHRPRAPPPPANHYPRRQRFAFVDHPPATSQTMQSVNPWHRNAHAVDKVPAQKRPTHVQSDPPVASMALHANPRPFPRGTLTSFLTTDDTGIFNFKQLEAASSTDPLLEQGIRPSRRVRFAQTVQLVC